MGWVKIDDHFNDHPKIVQAGPLAMAMQVAGLCYCNRYLTDGFIPKSVAKKLLDFEGIALVWDHNEMFGGGQDVEWSMVVDSLVENGIWEKAEGGWLIHDYTEYQQPRERVLKEKEAAKERMKKNRNAAKSESNKDSVNVRANNNRTSKEVHLPHTHTPKEEPSPSLRSGEESPASAADAPARKQGNGKAPPCPHEQIIAAYHEELPELRPVQVWNDQRRKLLQSRWREKPERQDVEYWRRYFRFIRESEFLMGQTDSGPGKKPFSADLEWLIRPTNFAKIVEGKYHDAS